MQAEPEVVEEATARIMKSQREIWSMTIRTCSPSKACWSPDMVAVVVFVERYAGIPVFFEQPALPEHSYLKQQSSCRSVAARCLPWALVVLPRWAFWFGS